VGSRAISIRRLAITFGIVVALGVLTNLIVGLPVLKTSAYLAMIQQYAQARPIAPTGTPDEELKWKVEVLLPGGGRARLQTSGHMDVVRLHFPGDTQPRPLYDYEDYSNPIAVRLAGDSLFVYWAETLLHTDHWLLVYDLRNRREVDRRRVDPEDMPSEQ
jgi:hypothetical protein